MHLFNIYLSNVKIIDNICIVITIKLQQRRCMHSFRCMQHLLIGQTWIEIFCGNTFLCDGISYNSAKNMAYIPNERVDMHGDVDPGAFSSNCNTMDIISTSDFDFFRGSSCTLNYHHSIKCSTAKK